MTARTGQPRSGARRTGGLALGALGVVYGDIGTSPLYALRESFEGAGHELAVTDANGEASSPIAVPNAGNLVGLTVYHQWLIWDPSVNNLNIVTSNAGAATVQN